MGFFKKLFKPVSKVLDKIVPNEVKPFLPYAAAFAPMLAPGMFGAGASGISSLFGGMNPIASRAIMGGGLNALSQLSQEGNEGDLNLMSAGLGALSGAMTGSPADYKYDAMRAPGANSSTLFEKAKMGGMDFLGKGNKIYNTGMDKLGLNMDTLKMAALPGSTAIGDSMYAEGERAMKDYERALLDYENGLAEGQFATDAGRRAAIIAAMTAGQHTQQVIDDTLAELGLRDGGIISLQNGGRVNFRGGGMDASQPDFGGIPEAIKNVENNKIEEVNELVELDELDRLDGFAEMLAGLNEDSEEYAIKSNLGIQLAEEIAAGFPDNYMIGPVDLVNYMNSRKNNYKDQIKETELKEIDDGKKEVLMENIKNTSFAFANGGVTSVLPQGMEMDYRQGGFIPMGSKERADDVPARVSKNEFVMTADAVRAAGGGSINQGAKKMYEVMNNLEARA